MWIKLFFSKIWDFVKPFIVVLLSKSGTILATSAIQAVTTTAHCLANKDSSEKRQSAYNLIVDDLKKQGISVGIEITSSMINTAIELAVQKIKSK
ncbi:MAG: hypothetical protein RBR68_16050 [Tenuifilaceae bacterium]|jgi:hypothetical protein|nr:hypothetical protein [Tenuifilaceae bacterium]